MTIPSIDISQDLESLTNFKRDSSGVMKQIRKTGRPVALTVNGKAKAILMDPAAFQYMVDSLRSFGAIGRGLAEAKRGEGVPVDEFFDELDKE